MDALRSPTNEHLLQTTGSRRCHREISVVLTWKNLPSSQGFPMQAVRRRDGPPGRLYEFARFLKLPTLVAAVGRGLRDSVACVCETTS